MDTKKRYRIQVLGIVQGVSFRYSTCEFARTLPVTGYVKNVSDGSVEIVAEGEIQKLSALKKWVAHGPPVAQVSEVTFHEEPLSNSFSSFDINY